MRSLTVIPLLLAALWLQGCVALTAASVVPGALYEVVANEFAGEEVCLPNNISPTLAAIQSSLRSMKLDVDVLEIQENGYAIAFGNNNLEGSITLNEMSPKLTTLYVKARSNVREASVEQAIIDSVRAKLNRKNAKKGFSFSGYHNLRAKPDIKTARLGWYRPDAELKTHRNGKSEWVSLKLPSGKIAYLKRDIVTVATN